MRAGAALRDRIGPRSYRAWLLCYDRLSHSDRKQLRQMRSGGTARPKFSLLLICRGADGACMNATVRSLLAQSYEDWELCVACGGSAEPSVLALRQDSERIKLADIDPDDTIASALNKALHLSTGDFVAVLDGGVRLHRHALLFAAAAAGDPAGADLIFTDEDRIDERGRRSDPWFKPDWNPALMLSCDAFGGLGLFRRELIERLGGFRPGFDAQEIYDLALRCATIVDRSRIKHITRVLYHRRRDDNDPRSPTETGRRVVEHHLRETGLDATVEISAAGYRIRYPVPRPAPRVSVIMATTGEASILGPGLKRLLALTTYPDFEILLLIDETRHRRLIGADFFGPLAADVRLRVITYADRSFNYSWVNNLGARHARGDVLCLLNDDTEILTADWLEPLVARTMLHGVGAVGAMLYFPDDTIQHAGVILGPGGVGTHVFAGAPRGHLGYAGRASLEQDLSCVTAACMTVRASAFRALGGFDEALAIAFNDVDLCLRLRAAGWRILWTPTVELRHRESASIGRHNQSARAGEFARDMKLMRKRWARTLDADPFYNRNLSFRRPYELAFPPRPARAD